MMVRLFVKCALRPTAPVDLTPEQGHYVVRVMRLKVGDEVLLFNGQDGEWRAGVDAVDKHTVRLSTLEQVRPQSVEQSTEVGPWLAFAPVKKTGTDFIVQKATELGVAKLIPVTTANSQTDRVNLERLRANAIEAAEQCGRLSVPIIDPVTALRAFIDNWPLERRLVLLDETGQGIPVSEGLSEVGQSSCGFLVGPEGGFQPIELENCAKLPFVTRVSLGARILRAETASVSVLAVWQALVGDWH